MKHLVLGSEGQIGKYVCDHIESQGDAVIRWDIILDPEHDLRLSYDKNVDSKLIDAMEKSDFIHFLAYDVGGSKYLSTNQNSLGYIHNNIRIMENTFLALSLTKKPFYFASSQMSNMTDSVYGQLKAVGESYTKALGGVNVKFWNVYGYESDPEKSHVITDFIKMMYEDGQIICRTDGTEERHFTHAKDAAAMLYYITQNYNHYKGTTQDVVNSREPWVNMRQLAKYVYMGFADKELVPPYDVEKKIFFSMKKDTSQTVKNLFNPLKPINYQWGGNLFDIQMPYIKLHQGIQEMIDLIGKDYE
jgi:nucleoside-diphosphate-sugar epimerase